MSPLTDEAPLATDRPDLVHAVRDVLYRTGFDESRISERCGVADIAKLSAGIPDRDRLLWRTRDGDPLSTLFRLFGVGVPVELPALRSAVAPMDPADWAALGLIRIDGATARRAVALWPSGPLVVAYDHARPAEGQRPDHVLGVTGTTVVLAEVTMRRDSRLTLDLGTGSGYQALLAAVHSRRVIGTDRNARAVGFARFNALLNGIGNVEFLCGDLYDPVEGLRFDLIVSNPPFVVSPDNELIFRDSGLKRDEISERVIRGAAAHLEDGGHAQSLCSWVRIAGQDWQERLVGWVEGSGCDAWISYNTNPIDVHADHWIRQGDVTDPQRVSATFDRWMAYFREEGIEAIDTGLIVLRRRAGGANWVRFDDRRLNHPNGVGIQVGFDAHDLIERAGDDRDLLALRLRCRPELRLIQHLKPAPVGWMVDEAQCILGQGLEYEGTLTQDVFHLLTLCRGQEPLSQVLAQVAARTGQDLGANLPAWLAAVRDLIGQGFLWPMDEARPV